MKIVVFLSFLLLSISSYADKILTPADGPYTAQNAGEQIVCVDGGAPSPFLKSGNYVAENDCNNNDVYVRSHTVNILSVYYFSTDKDLNCSAGICKDKQTDAPRLTVYITETTSFRMKADFGSTIYDCQYHWASK
ncbi:MAG: hypothetical protein H6623_03315 [Bdellovibrionaceae bacterium]|nr:hypothetical protein [Pseudobdellovibrionaceae bacterium]